MGTIKYKVGDVLKRKSDGHLRLITKVEVKLGYYTLDDAAYPGWSHASDLSCSTVDNGNMFEFVEHLNEVEFNKRMKE
jgi:hypothetical protein